MCVSIYILCITVYIYQGPAIFRETPSIPYQPAFVHPAFRTRSRAREPVALSNALPFGNQRWLGNHPNGHIPWLIATGWANDDAKYVENPRFVDICRSFSLWTSHGFPYLCQMYRRVIHRPSMFGEFGSLVNYRLCRGRPSAVVQDGKKTLGAHDIPWSSKFLWNNPQTKAQLKPTSPCPW